MPEIRIKNAWLLRDNASEHLNELWGDGTPLRTHDEYEDIVKEYQKAWEPHGQKIIQGMCDALDLTFRQNIVDVYIAPWFAAFSDPMVIGVQYKPDQFVATLTHELIHRLLTDNDQSAYDTPYGSRWKKLFDQDNDWNTLVHIPVHATMQAIFDEVLGEPERTKQDIAYCQEYPAYRAAWEYVGEHGYQMVISQLKADYKRLRIKKGKG